MWQKSLTIVDAGDLSTGIQNFYINFDLREPFLHVFTFVQIDRSCEHFERNVTLRINYMYVHLIRFDSI